ncbi:hypothetical protein JCGZ_02578 [Jatropha curcas]|uniref:Cytochrome P450 n=1 Tax=Jatropha curcas TaxID=180498 RepID=A0A067KX35_JATCU|nr:hypothetical protein JCGZ_02578 [Jatropha curcas]
MELWFIILFSLTISALFKSIFNFPFTTHNHRLPAGPIAFPIIGNLQWLRRSSFDIEPILRYFHSKFGPIFTRHFGPRPAIYGPPVPRPPSLCSKRAVFADRPPALPIVRIASYNQHSISSSMALLGVFSGLEEGEIVSLCSELLNVGTDTTSTALQWIIANLVKYPEIQEKVFVEIKGVVSNGEEEVKEVDLQKMPYLKAVLLEGLRRRPPGHLLLAHSVSEDVTLDKYLITKKGTINVMVAEMGWDSKVWDDPMAFNPERFLNDEGELLDFDITGSREIKMMPFGVGRRMCPGYSLAMLHLEYFVANLIWSFEWKAINNEDIDLSEKHSPL